MISKSKLKISVLRIVSALFMLSTGVACDNAVPFGKRNASKEKDKIMQTEIAAPKRADVFLIELARFYLAEIQLAKLAQENCGNNEVKYLGMMMENTHLRYLKQLNAIAAKRSIALPEALSLADLTLYNSLAPIKGKQFDLLYCAKVIAAHKEAINGLKIDQRNINDVDLEDWIQKTLPELRTHLVNVMICEENCKRLR